MVLNPGLAVLHAAEAQPQKFGAPTTTSIVHDSTTLPNIHLISAIMSPNMSLFSVNAILILSTDDRSRILTKYYNAPHTPPNSTSHPGANPYPTVKEQKALEKGLLEKTNKQSSDIILYDGRIVVFKMEGDVMLYAVGGPEENEILLFGVILALRDALAILLK